MIKIVGGMGGSVSSGGWWDVSSATPLAAWQAKGAASAAAAKLDLTGNGHTLTGLDPSWTSADGWTEPSVPSSYFDPQSFALGENARVVWYGIITDGNLYATAWYNSAFDYLSCMIISTYEPWDAVIFQYGGSNSTRIYLYDPNIVGLRIFAFVKNATTNTFKVYVDGILISEKSVTTTPANRTPMLSPGLKCCAAALYGTALADSDISAISTALNNL